MCQVEWIEYYINLIQKKKLNKVNFNYKIIIDDIIEWFFIIYLNIENKTYINNYSYKTFLNIYKKVFYIFLLKY